ncbi:FAD dependent oxidoreductase [Aspergillus costaricaensis CBS 115574]|uniref:FAD dependent oxidoreductase n=1 Tax=Aspergillus costaricaensis CBS 115574 TaxID=1448317 RepID=A0ACD1I312_9EURO|nr:FAD dependent oxidoreductase [Aspergillus costaricaensis CBS 115574]RAK84391.1 FAD dependent oxidoreductase [Aspergillus costaricaensis CBS 115574]
MDNEQVNARAPNPAEYPEIPSISKSYWIREHQIEFEDQCARVPLPAEVDVVIIGSGITGATVAYQIARSQPHLRVELVEARGLCTGATGRNGGHIGRPEVFHIRELAEEFGAEEAIKLRRFGLRNRNMMVDAITELGAVEETDLQLNGTIVVFETAEEKAGFVADLEWAREHGHEPEGYVIDDQEGVLSKITLAGSHAQHGAAYIETSGTIYPRKLVAVLLRAALQQMSAFTVHSYTPVSSVTHDPTAEKYNYTVSTNRGDIKARAVFHATNGYASHLLPSLCGTDGVYGCRAHMLGVQPNRTAPATCQLSRGFGYQDFWHWILQRPNHGPYLYGLATAEEVGDYNDNVTLADDNPHKRGMIDFLASAFPHHFQDIDIKRDVLYDWTGIQGFTQNGASIVGRPTLGSPGEYVSVGHNGEGMGRCFASAMVAADAMLNYLDGNKFWTPPEWFPASFARNLGAGDM